MKKIVSTENAPAAIGPYSQAVWAGDFLYMSGQLGIDPANGKLADGGVKPQAERALENISNILASQGLSGANVVKTLVFLTDMENFKTFNEVYAKFFSEAPPARSCVAAAALPMGAAVEIEAIAHK
jgi:2-iminobutanoate/2-iminopropanoate deaminase